MNCSHYRFQKAVSIVLCLLGSLLFSCQEGDMDIAVSIPSDQLIYTHEIDTVTVNLSTVHIDTIITSSSGTLLAGRAVPLQGGIVQVQGYFQLNPPPTLSLTSQKVRFDSLVLYLRYSDSYGDTTHYQTLSLHELTSLPSQNRSYSNISSLAYEATALTRKTFRARPTQDSVLAFRLPTTVGHELMNLLTTSTTLSEEMINKWNKGLTLVSDPTETASVIGFDASQSFMRLYYLDETSGITSTADLTLRETVTQFNTIHYTSATYEALNTLINKGKEISSSITNQEAILQMGVGLLPKIEIPYIHQLKQIENYIAINRVFLDVLPIRKSLNDFTPPPTTLSLQVLNRSNQILGDLLDMSNATVTATYSVDLTKLTLEDKYTFDLTDYFINVMDGAIENRGLLLALPSGSDNGSQVQGVSFGNSLHPTDKIRLRVYYTVGN